MNQILASARFQVTCRTAVIEEGRRNVIRVKTADCSPAPRIIVPYRMALSLYDMAKGAVEPPLYDNQDFLMTHARKVCTFLQRKRITVRVTHERIDNERVTWRYEMIGLV